MAGTIVLDCINLSPAAGKVTPRDVACVELLEERFPELPARDAVFGALQAAKFDVTGACARLVASPPGVSPSPWGRGGTSLLTPRPPPRAEHGADAAQGPQSALQ